ncbi:MAG TPA: hypothetical protein VIY72_05150 [Acidimicrobiales bacterium]
MTRRFPLRNIVTAGVLAGVVVLAAACGGGDDEQPSVTLPSSLTAPTTTPGAIPSTQAPATTTAPERPRPDGSPGISAVRAELAQPGCANGATGVVVTVELAPEPPVRAVTAFLDGSTTAAAAVNGPASALTVPSVPCDGVVHSILVIATGENRVSTTEAVAIRTPTAS